jgi:hypothetical protein
MAIRLNKPKICVANLKFGEVNVPNKVQNDHQDNKEKKVKENDEQQIYEVDAKQCKKTFEKVFAINLIVGLKCFAEPPIVDKND